MRSSRSLLVSVLSLAPSVASANLSHISGGGAAFLLALGGVLVFVPPIAACSFFQKDRRSYLLAAAGWVLVLLSAFFGYTAIPFQTRLHFSLLVFPSILFVSFLAYVSVAFVLSRKSRRNRERQ